jgi:hypothetical protein
LGIGERGVCGYETELSAIVVVLLKTFATLKIADQVAAFTPVRSVVVS